MGTSALVCSINYHKLVGNYHRYTEKLWDDLERDIPHNINSSFFTGGACIDTIFSKKTVGQVYGYDR